jgi:hypothetical protein
MAPNKIHGRNFPQRLRVRSAIRHAGVGDGVEGARQQEHGADKPGGNAEDVGIEEHHIEHDVVEDNMAGGIAHAVANFFFHGNDMRVHVDSLALKSCTETGYSGCKPSPFAPELRFLVIKLRFFFSVIAVALKGDYY